MPEFAHNGVVYLSTQDAAMRLEMAPSTLRVLIARKTLPAPPMVRLGARRQRGYTEQWIKEAQDILDAL